MKLKIEKNIALPPRRAGGEVNATARRMEVGDSVKVDKYQVTALCQGIRRHGSQAAMRKIDDKTWRVWRTK